MSEQWKEVTATDPPDGATVLTKIDDTKGPRNEAYLTRRGNLWYVTDESMYVYYAPTHFAESPMARVTWQAEGVHDVPQTETLPKPLADDHAKDLLASANRMGARWIISPTVEAIEVQRS